MYRDEGLGLVGVGRNVSEVRTRFDLVEVAAAFTLVAILGVACR